MIHWKAPPSRRRLEPCVPRQGWLRRRLGLHSAVLESGHAAVLELGCRQVNRHPRDQERGATNHHSEKSNAELRGHIGTSARPKTRPVSVGPRAERAHPLCHLLKLITAIGSIVRVAGGEIAFLRSAIGVQASRLRCLALVARKIM